MIALGSARIKIVAYGKIRLYLGENFNDEVLVEDGSSVRDLFEILEKPEKEIWMANVNGLLANEKRILNDGDEVSIFEPVGGG
ncbi:MAG: MoaD/ThiS family protein [Candidatus Bathyarchaeota archaeon]|nr:MoaD/ThiS family protein [Candidatus Bathyarchaeota archaeon]MDH5687720.1 MoaD/ThiS family protein [Candidatus Bathyarchaeota archaeon]